MENLARLTTHIRTELSKVIIGQRSMSTGTRSCSHAADTPCSKAFPAWRKRSLLKRWRAFAGSDSSAFSARRT